MNSTPPNSDSPVMAGIPRPVEAVAAVAGLIIAAPVLALAALGIFFTSRGRIIFRQSRVGQGGRIFVLYKFRTMQMGQVGPQVTAGDDSRITYIGRLLRKTKMDELPELWNVLKGDMSLVGPRPEVPRYVDLNNNKWQRVLQVRPGITDPLTLRLRNEEELLAKVKGDRERFYLESLQPFKLRGYLEYLHHRSWQNDLSILWSTCIAVIFPKFASDPPMNEILACKEEGTEQ